MAEDRIIMGIDPGTTIMGYGIVQIKGKEVRSLSMGVLRLDKIRDHAAKLRKIFERTLGLIDEYGPDELAIEAPFYGKNVQSMLKLGRAQGVAYAAALYRDIPVMEYSPRKIKQSITGNGNSSKEQVAGMLGSILRTSELPAELDATDGAAVAVCHYFQQFGKGTKGKQYSGWDKFIKDNPDRLS